MSCPVTVTVASGKRDPMLHQNRRGMSVQRLLWMARLGAAIAVLAAALFPHGPAHMAPAMATASPSGPQILTATRAKLLKAGALQTHGHLKATESTSHSATTIVNYSENYFVSKPLRLKTTSVLSSGGRTRKTHGVAKGRTYAWKYAVGHEQWHCGRASPTDLPIGVESHPSLFIPGVLSRVGSALVMGSSTIGGVSAWDVRIRYRSPLLTKGQITVDDLVAKRGLILLAVKFAGKETMQGSVTRLSGYERLSHLGQRVEAQLPTRCR